MRIFSKSSLNQFISMLFVLASFLSISVCAQDYKSKITVDDNTGGQWIEGEIKQIKLIIWPVSEIDQNDFKSKFENKVFADYFYIGEILKIENSKNNPEVLEVIADATLKKAIPVDRPIIWHYLALNILLDTSEIKTVVDPNRLTDYASFSVERTSASNLNFVIISIILASFVLVFYTFLKKKKRTKKEKVDYRKILLNAKTREELEFLYDKKTDLLEFFQSAPALVNLLKIINKHQYKKEWSEDDFYEINFVLDEIKDGLK